MPLGVPPPLALALSLPGAAPGAAAGCWACARRVINAVEAATNASAARSFMTDDCTRNGGRLAAGSAFGRIFPILHDGDGRALLMGACRYQSIKSILKNSLDAIPPSAPPPSS